MPIAAIGWLFSRNKKQDMRLTAARKLVSHNTTDSILTLKMELVVG